MSNLERLQSLRSQIESLQSQRHALAELRKQAFMPAPPMPQGAPPADPSMMQGGAPPQGAPMDPAMMQGTPPQGMPMDPAMMQQGGAPPMDPAAMQQGAAPQPPASVVTPEMLDEIVGAIEDIGQQVQGEQQTNAQFRKQVEQALNELVDQVSELDQRLAQLGGAAQPPTA